jgi:hypothetical protein
MTAILQGPPPTEAAPKQAPIQIDVNNITQEQKITLLRHVHTFFSNFDRVPGSFAAQWANSLDALAVLCNFETKLMQQSMEVKPE